MVNLLVCRLYDGTVSFYGLCVDGEGGSGLKKTGMRVGNFQSDP